MEKNAVNGERIIGWPNFGTWKISVLKQIHCEFWYRLAWD
jgi:hypothetical protein